MEKCKTISVTDTSNIPLHINEKKRQSSPELLGVVLLYLRPLFHKLDVAVQQVEARLRVLVDDIVLILKEEQHRATCSHAGIRRDVTTVWIVAHFHLL